MRSNQSALHQAACTISALLRCTVFARSPSVFAVFTMPVRAMRAGRKASSISGGTRRRPRCLPAASRRGHRLLDPLDGAVTDAE
jgi:hypothetical protein